MGAKYFRKGGKLEGRREEGEKKGAKIKRNNERRGKETELKGSVKNVRFGSLMKRILER